MKYLGKKFSSPANSKEFVDNWEATFGKTEETEPVKEPEEREAE